jgi:hypothetical protein
MAKKKPKLYKIIGYLVEGAGNQYGCFFYDLQDAWRYGFTIRGNGYSDFWTTIVEPV